MSCCSESKQSTIIDAQHVQGVYTEFSSKTLYNKAFFGDIWCNITKTYLVDFFGLRHWTVISCWLSVFNTSTAPWWPGRAVASLTSEHECMALSSLVWNLPNSYIKQVLLMNLDALNQEIILLFFWGTLIKTIIRLSQCISIYEACLCHRIKHFKR